MAVVVGGIQIDPQGQTLVVNITIPSTGGSVEAYTATTDRTFWPRTSSGAQVSFPVTISSPTTFYVTAKTDYLVSAKANGVEVAGGYGQTVTVNVDSNRVTVTPAVRSFPEDERAQSGTYDALGGVWASTPSKVYTTPRPVQTLLMSAYDTGQTDPSADLETAINAAFTAAQGAGRARLILDSRQEYVLARAPLTGANGQNAQVRLPFQSTKPTWVELIGMPAGSWTTVPGGNSGATGTGQPSGTVIRSTVASNAFSISNGLASIIGGPASFYSTTRTFSRVSIAMKNITLRQPTQPQLCGLDLGWVLSCDLEHVMCDTIQTSDGTNPNNWVVATNPQALGIQLPFVNMNPPARTRNISVDGHYAGIGVGELWNGEGDTRVGWCSLGLALDWCYHPNRITRFLDINNIYGIAALDPATGVIGTTSSPKGTGEAIPAGGTPAALLINHWDIQRNNGQTTGFNRVYEFWDNTSHPFIDANLSRVDAVGTGVVPGAFLMGGTAVHARLRDMYQAAGAIGSANVKVPASGTAQTLQNAAGAQIWRDTMLRVTGGTVTDVAIDGVSTGLTSGTFIVPVNKQFTLTYSVAPTLSAVVL